MLQAIYQVGSAIALAILAFGAALDAQDDGLNETNGVVLLFCIAILTIGVFS